MLGWSSSSWPLAPHCGDQHGAPVHVSLRQDFPPVVPLTHQVALCARLVMPPQPQPLTELPSITPGSAPGPRSPRKGPGPRLSVTDPALSFPRWERAPWASRSQLPRSFLSSPRILAECHFCRSLTLHPAGLHRSAHSARPSSAPPGAPGFLTSSEVPNCAPDTVPAETTVS